MRQNVFAILLTIFSCHFLISQNQEKHNQLVKSDAPLQLVPSFDFSLKNIDSTIITKESFAKVKRALALLETDQDIEVLKILSTVNEIDLEKNGLLFLKGTLELKSDDLTQSSSTFSKYLDLVANDSIKSSVYHILGAIDLKKEYFLSAASNFKKSYNLNNKNYYAALLLGYLSEDKNDLESAEFYYRIGVQINPNLNNVWNSLVSIYQQKGNHAEAEKILSKIISDEPNSPLPYSNRSYSNLKMGNTSQALKDVNKSIKLFPENSYAFRNRALIYMELKEVAKACQDIETAMKLGYKEKYGSDLDAIKAQNCKK